MLRTLLTPCILKLCVKDADEHDGEDVYGDEDEQGPARSSLSPLLSPVVVTATILIEAVDGTAGVVPVVVAVDGGIAGPAATTPKGRNHDHKSAKAGREEISGPAAASGPSTNLHKLNR